MPKKLKIEEIDLSKVESGGMNPNRFGSSEFTGLQFWVYKDGRKEWHYRYKSPYGHRTSIKIGGYPGVDYLEASAKVSAELALLNKGLDPVENRRYLKRGQMQQEAHARIISSDGFSVAVYAADFLEYVFRTKKNGTHRRYAGVVKNYVVPLFGGFDVRHFFFPAYQELLMEIDAPSQRSNTHKTMRVFFSYLVEMEIISANPLLGRKSLSTKLKMSPRRTYLSPSELHQFLNGLSEIDANIDVKQMLMIQLYTGLRVGEIAALTWSDIDFRARIIKHSVVIMKSGKPAETIMSDAVRRMLLEWKRANPDRVDKVFDVTSDYVITHVKNRLKKWVNFTTHDLRRTVRTYLQEMGCPQEIREQITNHSQPQGVAAHYDHAKQQQSQLMWLTKWADKLAEVKESASALQNGIEVGDDDPLLAEFADLLD